MRCNFDREQSVKLAALYEAGDERVAIGLTGDTVSHVLVKRCGSNNDSRERVIWQIRDGIKPGDFISDKPLIDHLDLNEKVQIAVVHGIRVQVSWSRSVHFSRRDTCKRV